jgi:hypothetical protein
MWTICLDMPRARNTAMTQAKAAPPSKKTTLAHAAVLTAAQVSMAAMMSRGTKTVIKNQNISFVLMLFD